MDSYVLVTGGAGFIGSHVVDALLASGRRVVVLDDLSSGHRKNLAAAFANPLFQFVEGDVADGLFAPLAEVSGRPSGIVHLAAQVSVARSVQAPLKDTRTNINGVISMLEFARCMGRPKVVFASSAAIYGDTEVVPVGEAQPLQPLSPYGLNKLAGEQWLAMYSKVHGVPVSPLRFFNVFGPRQDPTSAYSGVISIFLARASSGQSLTIFGDGSQTRDFVYVGDVVRAILAALARNKSTLPANVGTGRSTSVQSLAEECLRLAGNSSAIQYGPARVGDIVHSCAKVERLAADLAIRAETSFADGLRTTYDWFLSESL